MNPLPLRDLSLLLAPRSVALVGASDRSRWSSVAFDNLSRSGFSGRLHLVSRRGGLVHGRVAGETCAALGEAVDVGIVMVPAETAAESIADLAAAGCRHAIVLTSGFAETGAGGAEAQTRLLDVARAHGVTLMGPNSLGLVNLARDTPLWTAPWNGAPLVGRIAAISQSGQVAYHLNNFAQAHGIGLSHLVSTGNEADLDFVDFARHFLDDPEVRAVALYLETLRHPDRFAAAAEHAHAAGKPMVVFKIGESDAAARTALAHTGGLVGDDRIFDGVCRRWGAVRVRSMEDLVCTADVIATTGVLRSGGLGLVSNSGGICSIAADTASLVGLRVPDLGAEIADRLRAVLPSYATAQNPLDITGAAASDRSLFETALKIVATEPAFAALVCFADLPNSRDSSDASLLAGLEHTGRGVADAPIPAFVMNCLGKPVTAEGRALVAEYGLPFIAAGLQRGLAALAEAFRWSDGQRERRGPAPPAARPATGGAGPRPRSEFETLAHLVACGVPVVPTELATTAAEARAAARRHGGPVALKIASPDVPHKSEIGGVALNVAGDAAVTEAFDRIAATLPAGARLDGVLVAPMRTGGIELFAGVTRDPQWGLVLGVGLGGIWVETLKDVSIRPLPVAADEVRVMISELKGAPLLSGRRGRPAADLDAVASCIERIAEAALALGAELDTLEVNPIWVRGSDVEALDALALWHGPPAADGRIP